MGIREFMALYPIKDGETGISTPEPYSSMLPQPCATKVQRQEADNPISINGVNDQGCRTCWRNVIHVIVPTTAQPCFQCLHPDRLETSHL